MERVARFGKKLKYLSYNPFLFQLSFFIIVPLAGFLALKLSKAKSPSSPPAGFDYFFTSMSATTVSSMATVEMEAFSNLQLVIITLLMLLGCEVFTSLIGLLLQLSKSITSNGDWIEGPTRVSYNDGRDVARPDGRPQIELSMTVDSVTYVDNTASEMKSSGDDRNLMFRSTKCLAYAVLGYHLVIHVTGFTLVCLYSSLVPSVRRVLNDRGISIQTFSAFLITSTFSNCGFVPINENMMVFKENSGLLLLLIPQVLLGNTLYPPCLRLVIWVLKILTKRPEFGYILIKHEKLGYEQLLPTLNSVLLAVTACGLIILQFILFSAMEWGSQLTAGLNLYQKIVAILFQVVNTRHSGESTFDLSMVSPAILVLFIVAMYLPPYTTFLPTNKAGEITQPSELPRRRTTKRLLMDCLVLSPLSYLAFFIIVICITERERLRDDPLNFNVLNITLEVMSAYCNVGYSVGYSCKRRLNPTGSCKDAWYGFVGRWSMEGKIVLILVMYFGRLKKFFSSGGKAWKLA